VRRRDDRGDRENRDQAGRAGLSGVPHRELPYHCTVVLPIFAPIAASHSSPSAV